jgi:hypothetical protein
MFYNCTSLRKIKLNNCSRDTIKTLTGDMSVLPNNESVYGAKGEIYVKGENVNGLEAPDGWKFVSVN